jgi:hypothetical protein
MARSVGRDVALEAARKAALEAGYPWVDPVRVTRGLRYYWVMSNWQSHGGTVHIKVHARTGAVASVRVTPM